MVTRVNIYKEANNKPLDFLKQALQPARLLARQLAIKRFFWRFGLPFDAIAEGRQEQPFLDQRKRLL
jgi:hypothetical protein